MTDSQRKENVDMNTIVRLTTFYELNVSISMVSSLLLLIHSTHHIVDSYCLSFPFHSPAPYPWHRRRSPSSEYRYKRVSPSREFQIARAVVNNATLDSGTRHSLSSPE